MILVDTSVWSLALRRRPEQLNELEMRIIKDWTALTLAGDVMLIAPIRQELLSGIRHQVQCEKLQRRLDDFACLPTLPADYDHAARCFNLCRGHGVAAGALDMIICATGIHHKLVIMTTDPDFTRYAKHLPIQLLLKP